MQEPMPLSDILALLKWLEPVIPALMEAFRNNQPVEAVFAVNRTAMEKAFTSARSRRARRPTREG